MTLPRLTGSLAAGRSHRDRDRDGREVPKLPGATVTARVGLRPGSEPQAASEPELEPCHKLKRGRTGTHCGAKKIDEKFISKPGYYYDTIMTL